MTAADFLRKHQDTLNARTAEQAFAPGYIRRGLKDAHKAVAKWPAWMRREAGIQDAKKGGAK